MSKQVKIFKPVLRSLIIRSETANTQTRSVEVVVASENPVERYDHDTGESYGEILSMDGLKFRTVKRQLPIVDSHDRSTIRNVLGSVRNLRVEGTELIGDAVFAKDAASQEAFDKLMDGHLTDFSITATPYAVTRIERGQSQPFRDQQVTGPADIVTHWVPTDASLVAAGADETSTVRELLRSYQPPIRMDKKMMTEEIKNKLTSRGMPVEINDMEDALEWLMSQGQIENEAHVPAEPEEVVSAMAEEPKEEVQNAVARALAADVKRRKEIVALCKKANLTRAFADALCDSAVSLETAREKVLSKVIERQAEPLGRSGEQVTVTRSSDDKFRAAVGDALVQRAIGATGSRINPFSNGKPAEGSADFASMGMLRMAEEILRRGDINTSRMTSRDIAMVALGHEPTLRRLNIQRAEGAYHTTGMFPNLLLDAANKTLLAGYEESPTTYQMWARTAPAVADFKAINRVRFSESQDLEMVPENNEYPESKPTDARESYKVDKFGRVFSVSWETVVNDDLDAISRIPQMHGAAARRTQNKKVYEVLTANNAMSDGVTLFNATHSNQSGSAAAPSAITLNAAYLSMMRQTGATGVVLNIQPAFLIVPASYSATASILLTSLADPAVGGSAAGNANVNNLYGPNGDRRLKLIVEPQLDLASTTNWYVAAANSQIDTVEIAFLQGEESPVLENEWDFDKDVYKYKIRQTFGVKAIDWRGLFRNS